MSATSSNSAPDLHELRKRLTRDWLITAGVALLAMFGLAQLLLTQWVGEAVGRWAIITGLAIFYELRIFRQILPLMHAPGQKTLRSGVGPGVMLTLLSGLAYALMAGFLLVTQPTGWMGWLPASLAILALAADGLDGPVTRRTASETVGGGHLAREFRALGTLILTALAIHYGKLNAWLLIIGVMDYLLLFTRSWLGRRGKALHPPPVQPRHFLQGIYLVAVSITLWPIVPAGYAAVLGLVFGIPYFLIALRDWFILAGMLDPDQSQYRQVGDAIARALTGWLALSIRLLGAMAAATVAADMIFHFDLYAAAFPDAVLAGAVAVMLLVALPFLLMGIRARLFALIAFIALSIILLVMGQNTLIFIALLLLGLTIILGQGKIAVEPEDSDPPPTAH